MTTWNPQADTSQQGCGCQPTCTVKEVLSCTPRTTICFLAKEKKVKCFPILVFYTKFLRTIDLFCRFMQFWSHLVSKKVIFSQYFWCFCAWCFSRFAAFGSTSNLSGLVRVCLSWILQCFVFLGRGWMNIFTFICCGNMSQKQEMSSYLETICFYFTSAVLICFCVN